MKIATLANAVCVNFKAFDVEPALYVSEKYQEY